MFSGILARSRENRYIAHGQPLADGQTLQVTLLRQSNANSAAPLTWQEVVQLWSHESDFRMLTADALAQAQVEAFFWETPPITAASLQRPWECVLVPAPALAALSPDPQPFAEYLSQKSGEPVSVFPNLSGDATLIAPNPLAQPQCYTHLAVFLRQAPAPQIDALWETLGRVIQQKLQAKLPQPLWVSTSGLGVHWLHLRLDAVPKYFTHQPYRNGR